jgi:hypothetical protein
VFALVKRLMVIAVISCALGVVLIPALGAAWASPENILFSFCELPCFAGITPGHTAFASAVAVLHQHFDPLTIDTPITQSRVSPIVFITSIDGETIGGTLIGTSLVRTMTLDLDLPLIELIDLLGTPDCLYHERIIADVSTFTMIQWHFDADAVTATAFINVDSENQWGPYTVVRSFRLSASDDPCRSGRLEPRIWRGFPMFWRFGYED